MKRFAGGLLIGLAGAIACNSAFSSELSPEYTMMYRVDLWDTIGIEVVTQPPAPSDDPDQPEAPADTGGDYNVTVGGWYTSLEGAFVADPNVVGKANFGFVVKNQKGEITPKGQVQFNFKEADLTFHASEFSMMVVEDGVAYFEGLGAINKTDGYAFLITAVDADLNDTTVDDLFRIKIWDIDNSNNVIYDNQLGGSDRTIPTTKVEGGSISIHTIRK